MINKLKFKNFQSLKDVTLELGKVTVVKGKSDVGKSAIVRALNAFFRNSFNKEFAHHGEFPFGVAIEKDGKAAFGRRSKNGVEYELDGKKFTKTAKKVPEDIQNFLGIRHYKVDEDVSIFFNIQNQFDMPFLLKESSIAVPKIIGKISNLNVVMLAMRKMSADKISLVQEINFLTNSVLVKKDRLKEFSNLDAEEDLIRKCKVLKSNIETLHSRQEEISSILISLNSINSSLSEVTKKKYTYSSVDFSLLGKLEKFFTLKNLVSSKSKLDSSSFSERIIVFKSFLSKASSIKEVEDIKEAILSYVEFKERVSVFKISRERTKNILNTYLEELKEFLGDVCPLTNLAFYPKCKEVLLKHE